MSIDLNDPLQFLIWFVLANGVIVGVFFVVAAIAHWLDLPWGRPQRDGGLQKFLELNDEYLRQAERHQRAHEEAKQKQALGGSDHNR